MSVSLFDTNLESKVTLEIESTPISENMPFRILMAGDWGGDSDFSAEDLSQRKPIEIDRDEFDDVMRKITPEAHLKFDGAENNSLRLTFESLDDFHPDNIFQRLSLFSDLRDIRQKLKRTETFDEAAREVRSWYENSVVEETVDNQQFENSSSSFEVENLLDQILDNNQENPVRQNTAKSPLSEFVGNIVAPHIVKTDLEEQSKLLVIVDEVISDLMRKILHHNDFRQLESAWRGLYFLVRKVETGSKLKVFLMQITKEELLDNLSSVKSLTDTVFYRWLTENSLSITENNPWAVVSANYEFSPTLEDTAGLMRIAKVAEAGNCPFISHIKPIVFGIDSFAESLNEYSWKVSEESSEFKLWSALRSIPESSYLGLAIPRFIGRLPYGASTEPTELFSFEEFKDRPQHNEYMWLNSCFAYAFALSAEYKEHEWEISQDRSFDLENLPLHLYRFDSETVTKPCAEIEMSETAYNSITEQGMMTLISFRDADRIRLSALRSISATSSKLKGKWSSSFL